MKSFASRISRRGALWAVCALLTELGDEQPVGSGGAERGDCPVFVGKATALRGES
jgi:hypothetical protein